jgi:hypothetical protein
VVQGVTFALVSQGGGFVLLLSRSPSSAVNDPKRENKFKTCVSKQA